MSLLMLSMKNILISRVVPRKKEPILPLNKPLKNDLRRQRDLTMINVDKDLRRPSSRKRQSKRSKLFISLKLDHYNTLSFKY
jgi:hypothetical protein